MPIVNAFPVCGKSSVSNVSTSGSPFSRRVIARATARISPLSIPLTSKSAIFLLKVARIA